MKLAYSAASPYVRKVNACAIARGIDGKIERWKVGTTDPALLDFNPLSKVPTLVTDDGTMLYDSPVICEYIDSIGTAPKLFPPAGPARWKALCQEALGDGILDATQPRRREIPLPQDDGRKSYIELQQGKVKRALDVLERRRFARHVDHDRRDHHRLRAGLPRFPLRQRAVAARPSQARGLVRQGREAAATCRDHAGRVKSRF
jgi:glutathione S-transferase